MDDIKVFAKKKQETGDPDTNNKNIQPRYRNGIWHRKMYHTDKEKWEMKKYCQIREASEVLEWRKIPSTLEYWNGKTEMKEKKEESISENQENFLKPNSAAEISSRRQISGQYLL